MGTQQFYLKWNNHQSNMLTVFDQLLTNEALVDVTLACEGLSLKVHKMVLSACSPFFQSLFLENPCQHPIVIMKDMKYTDLKAVVDFMYRGEVNVSQDQLTALLKTAETLKVKGLAEVAGDNRTEGSDDVTQEENNQQIVSVPDASPLSETQTRTNSPSLRRKRARMRKRSLSDSNRSDSEDQVPSKIKEPDSPEIIEEVTPEVVDSSNDVHQRLLPALPPSHPSSSHSSPSKPQSHQKSQISTRHSTHHDSSLKSHTTLSSVHSQQSSSINVEEPHLSSQQDYSVERLEGPNILEQLPKLMEQIMTTENIPVLSDHSSQGPTLPSTSTALAIPTSETQPMHPAPGSCDNQTLLPCSLPYETSTSSHVSQDLDENQDVKPDILMSYEEPPMSPIAGPSHQDSSNSSMMMYTDTSGVPSIAGPSTSYQIDQSSQQRQPQDDEYNSNFIGASTVFEYSKTDDSYKAAEDYQTVYRSGRFFDCDMCNKRFENIDRLKAHLLEHLGGKRYICDVCERRFTQQSHLKRHLLTHTGEKPFICNVCKKRFRQHCNLKTHHRIHTGEKPYNCTVCKKRFSDSANLKRHQQTHRI